MASLVTVKGPNPGRTFDLKASATSIGRQPDVDIYLESLAVSRQHAKVVCHNGDYFIEDLGSSNGTFVDGVRLARPVRSTDGRYVVSGWRADTFVAGTPEARHDEVVSAAVRLHAATGKLERPRFLTQGPTAPWGDVDVFIAADRAAWEERPL